MKEIYKLRYVAGCALVVGAGVIAGCTTDAGPAIVTPEDSCLLDDANIRLDEGKTVEIGVKDMDFSFGGAQDTLSFTADGKKVKVEPSDADGTLITRGTTSSDGTITVTVGESPETGHATEDGQRTDFELTRKAGETMLHVEWDCPTTTN